MKKTKSLRVLSTLVAVIMILGLLLAGCGTKETASSSTTTTQTTQETQASQSAQTAETTQESETKEFVTISWYMRKPIDNMKDQEAVEAEANKIIKEKINAELKFTFIDAASWEEKMKMMSAAGEAYDLAFTSSWTNRLDLNVQRGAFLALDELIEKYGQNIKSKVDPRAWKAVTYNGEIMAIPGQTPFSQPSAFVFKKDLVEKYNFDYKSVKTLADLEPYLETIKKNEPNIIPILSTTRLTPGCRFYGAAELSKGIHYIEKTGEIMSWLDIPEVIELYKKVNDYYKKGYIAKDASTKTDAVAEAKSGRYAVMPDSGGYTEDGSKSSAAYGFPCVEALFGYPPITTAGMTAACTAISKTSENPERAMMLLDLIWGDKYLSNTLAYGIEGKNYTVIKGKGTDNPTVEAATGADQTWCIAHNWLGPLWDQWDSNWNSTAALEQMRANNDKADASATVGFTFDSEPVKTEVSQISAIYSEISPVLNTGVAPDIDKYIAEAKQKLKDAGIDKVMAEVQKQFNEWKASNK